MNFGKFLKKQMGIMSKMKWRQKPRAIGITGVILSVSGIFLFIHFPWIFQSLIDRELALSENSLSAEIWSEIPIPMYMEFYVFNWTNPHEFNKPGHKPILEELGPYVYKEIRKKVVDGWSPENGTVTFRQNRTWFFEPSLSNGNPEDVITTINTVAASAESTCDHLDFFSKFLIDSAILSLKPEYFIRAKVREIIFDGYDDSLLQLASHLPPGVFPHLHLPIKKLGWWFPRNGSADFDGIFNMKTGKDDLNHFGQLKNWDYKNKTDKFQSHCGAVTGSAGELFPVHTPINESISVFSTEICRPIQFLYEGETTVGQTPVSRYVAGKELFADHRDNPDNWCFCTSKKRDKCPPSGVLELIGCKWGAAAYLSAPHFMDAHPSYREGIIGMKPDPIRHKTFLDLDHRLRIPIRTSVALQINIAVEEHEGFSLFQGVERVFFPTIWFRQSFLATGFYGFCILVLFYLPHAVNILCYILILTGSLLIFQSIRTLFVQSPQKKSHVIYIPVPEVTSV